MKKVSFNIMKNAILLFLPVLILIACTDKKTVSEEGQILLKVGNKADAKVFKNMFELETVLPIETTDDYLMTSLSRVIRYKNKLIILDRNSSVFIVDALTGKIDNRIGSTGNGPGESKSIMDIAIDEKNENILIFNDYFKLVYYDMKGKFLKEERLNKLYDCFTSSEENLLFYNWGEGYSQYPYSIDMYSLHNKKMKTIGEEKGIVFPVRLYGRAMVKSKNIWFGSPIDFDLCRFTKNKIEEPYRLVPDMPVMTKEKLDIIKANPQDFYGDNDIMYGISAIRETEHYIIFISHSNRYGIFILNKATNEIYWEGSIEETDMGIRLSNYFSHDGDDDRIMFVISASEWIIFKKHGKGATTDNLPKELKDRIASFDIKEDDNPILLFYREKKQ